MGISVNNHSTFSINSGIRLSGVNHTVSSNAKTATAKCGSKSVKSNNQDKGNDLLSGGLMRNKAATVDLSEEGRNLSRKLRDGKINELKKKTSEARAELERVDDLNVKLRNGEELTEDDRDFINDELKKISSKKYVEKRFYVFTKQDYEAEDVMSELKEHMIQRIRLYSDMQKQLEAQKDSDEANKAAQMLAEAAHEHKQKKRIIDILNETLEDDEEEKDSLDNEKEAETFGDDSGFEENIIIEFENEEEPVKSAEDILKFRAIDIIDKNKELLDKMFAQSSGENDKVRDLNNKMDEELIRSYDLLTNGELSEEEKLSEFNKSLEYMDDLFSEKRIQTVVSKFDFDTWLISKIEFYSHDDIHEILKNDNVLKSKGGIDMVIDYLINANAY